MSERALDRLDISLSSICLNCIPIRVVESDFRKSNKSRMPKSFLSDFLTGRKPLLLWSF